MAARMVGSAGPDVERPAVPRTGDDGPGERSFGERSTAVGADGVDRGDLAVHVEQRHRLVEGADDALRAPRPDLGGVRGSDASLTDARIPEHLAPPRAAR